VRWQLMRIRTVARGPSSRSTIFAPPCSNPDRVRACYRYRAFLGPMTEETAMSNPDRRIASHIALTCGLALSLTANVQGQGLPNRVASGDVTASTAVLWAHATAAGTVHFEYGTDPTFGTLIGTIDVPVADPARPARGMAANLSPGTTYFYRATDA